MQTILLIGVIAECAVLLGFAIFKKCTRKIFLIVSAVTAASCLLVAIASGGAPRDDIRSKRSIKGHVYMAVQLLEQNRPEQALQEISQLTQKEGEKYGLLGLRALACNQAEDYTSGAYLLKDSSDEYLTQLYIQCTNSEPADIELTRQILHSTMESLSLSQGEIDRYNAEMSIRYTDALPSPEESDALQQIRSAVGEGRVEDAYQLATENAVEGTIVDSILLSEMFVTDYGPHFLSQEDEAYNALFQEISAIQIQLNRAAASSTPQDKSYQQLYSQYQLALQDLKEESAKRACNYLRTCYEKNTVYELAYHLQMSRLLFCAGEREEAVSHLNSIFLSDKLDQKHWLSLDIQLLLEAYLENPASISNTAFYTQYEQLMETLYQQILDYTDTDYYIFFCAYLNDLVNGIYISLPDVSAFPEIRLSVSTSSEIQLTEQPILLSDTGETIQDFQITEDNHGDISLCFVLDRSGSMDGTYMSSAKQAIKNFIMEMDSDIAAALVSFESSARLDYPMVDATYLISSQIDKIYASGGTNIPSGLLMGADQLSTREGKKIIILLSDGVDGNAESMPSTLSLLKRENIVVFPIGLPGCDEIYLKRIAEETGGVYFAAANASALNAVYEELRLFLKNTYTITYQVTETESTERKVHLQIDDSMVQARRRYTSIITGQQYSQIYDTQLSDFFKQIGGTLGGY